MPPQLVDLHTHTYYSDGRCSPAETVALAKERGLAALSITDHDSFAALDEARELCDNLEFITGIELSCTYDNTDIHLLAYFIDHTYPPLVERVAYYQEQRSVRGEEIVKQLNKLGVDLRIDTVRRIAGNGAMGRVHIADALLKEEFVATFDEAFSRYLGYYAPAYVPKAHFDPAEAIDLVHEAGGIAVLAHPGTVRRDDVVPHFKEVGLDGIEAYHSKHTSAQVRHYKRLATRLDLLISGGSDWHGRDDERAELGSQKVPYEILERMKEHTTAMRHKPFKEFPKESM